MSIENEIQDLTQSTTDLLNAVNTKKVTLDNAVSQAQTAVTDATSQVSLAAAEKVGAQTARDEAESHKNQAYTYSQSAASAVAYQDLTAIAQTKAETAVDVFVYDTSKDSDGGAWRQRTQHTSWYNEPLNTATRGSRKEFPAVAVIVAEANQVTIYDGDDPSLPMWMVFNAGSFANLIFGFNSLSASNGIICSANNSGNANYAGLMVVRFLNDDLIGVRNSTYPDNHNSILGVINRNSSWPQSGSRGLITSGGGLVSALANDVAMTVLPDAPIDQATGLPIPTIAVATDGGVSVIKDDGTVVDIGNALYHFLSVEFRDNLLFTSNSSSGGHTRIFEVDKLNADWASPLKIYDYWGVPYITQKSTWSSGKVALPTREQEFAQITSANKLTLVGSYLQSTGVPAAENEDLASYISSTYNTGWMNGDIKLATLSDTDDTDLVGSELVANGTFDTDTSGWGALNAVISADASGYLVVDDTADAGGDSSAYQDISTEVGKTYVITFDKISTTSLFYLFLGTPTNIYSIMGTSLGSAPGKEEYTFVANSTTTRISLGTGGVSVSKFDNVSVRLAEPDRSVNNNGLQVFGTVQKNPVATGADLVAYDSVAGAYLSKDFAGDFNGQSTFALVFWTYATYGGGTFFNWHEETGTTYRLQTYIDSGTNNLRVVWQGRQALNSNASGSSITGRWSMHCLVFDQGEFKQYQDGKLVHSSSTAISNELHNLKLEMSNNAKMALFRISGTAPTAEQIKKIYEDEKVLFQENAKATLHGTSDAVTALAYDEDTELLHVGTSAGRSVFQGLRRVDNTTDAVGTAISASNNLVVEE